MRRRTKRVRLQPRPFIILGVVGNVVAGVLFSPLTAVRHVRVEGAPGRDQPRLKTLLQGLKGVPCARVNAPSIESESLENPELRGARLARTPFGSAVLRISKRTPVARLAGSKDIALSEEGVVFSTSEVSRDLPRISLPLEISPVGLALGNGWPATDVAHLAVLVREMGNDVPLDISVKSGGRVCLNIDGTLIDLGRSQDLDRKVAVLQERLRAEPMFFAKFDYVSLVDPDSPAFHLRPGAPKP